MKSLFSEQIHLETEKRKSGTTESTEARSFFYEKSNHRAVMILLYLKGCKLDISEQRRKPQSCHEFLSPQRV